MKKQLAKMGGGTNEPNTSERLVVEGGGCLFDNFY